ncbi:hypothetical protein P692DRAFT_20821681 [Suillus brevipes Sb2]|nr:hypothetical protein P692DRAFT_20821681 [Suillus brevipes Sb2]
MFPTNQGTQRRPSGAVGPLSSGLSTLHQFNNNSNGTPYHGYNFRPPFAYSDPPSCAQSIAPQVGETPHGSYQSLFSVPNQHEQLAHPYQRGYSDEYFLMTWFICIHDPPLLTWTKERDLFFAETATIRELWRLHTRYYLQKLSLWNSTILL